MHNKYVFSKVGLLYWTEAEENNRLKQMSNMLKYIMREDLQ